MALNRTDTKQRAYRPIDVNNAAGTWIDEPSYNKLTDGKTIRCGNWLYEERLNESMQGVDYDLSPTAPREGEGEAGRARRGKRVNCAPNVQSSLFLTSQPTEHRADDHYQTTYRNSHDGSQHSKPEVGKRRAALEQQIVAEAEELMQSKRQPEPSLTADWETEKNRTNSTLPKKYATPYHPAEHEKSYLAEQPITIYSHTRETGMSPATGDNPYKKNANFTTPISLYNKSSTPVH